MGAEREQEEERPDEIELLLHAERPVMQEGRRSHRREVVRRAKRERDVADEEAARRRVERDGRLVERRDDESRGNEDDHAGGRRRGQDPSCAARVERREIQAAALAELAHEQ